MFPESNSRKLCGAVLAMAAGLCQAQQTAIPQPSPQEQAQQLVQNRIRAMALEAERLSLQNNPQVQDALRMARDSVLAQVLQQKWLSELQITPEMLQKEYQRQTLALGTTRYRLRHVLLAEEADARQVLEQVRKRKDRMAELAAQKSLDTFSRAQGGLADWVPVGDLQPSLLEAVRQLKKGQLAAEPVRTPAGWHVVMLEDVGPYQPPAMEQVIAQLQQALARQYLEGRAAALEPASAH